MTSQSAATSIEAGAQIPVTWSVASTNVAPVSAANVRITMSTDGGRRSRKCSSRPRRPTTDRRSCGFPNASTTQARIRVEAVGNVFFDVNDADFTVLPGAPEVSSPSTLTAQYSDAPAAPLTVLGHRRELGRLGADGDGDGAARRPVDHARQPVGRRPLVQRRRRRQRRAGHLSRSSSSSATMADMAASPRSTSSSPPRTRPRPTAATRSSAAPRARARRRRTSASPCSTSPDATPGDVATPP